MSDRSLRHTVQFVVGVAARVVSSLIRSNLLYLLGIALLAIPAVTAVRSRAVPAGMEVLGLHEPLDEDAVPATGTMEPHRGRLARRSSAGRTEKDDSDAHGRKQEDHG